MRRCEKKCSQALNLLQHLCKCREGSSEYHNHRPRLQAMTLPQITSMQEEAAFSDRGAPLSTFVDTRRSAPEIGKYCATLDGLGKIRLPARRRVVSSSESSAFDKRRQTLAELRSDEPLVQIYGPGHDFACNESLGPFV